MPSASKVRVFIYKKVFAVPVFGQERKVSDSQLFLLVTKLNNVLESCLEHDYFSLLNIFPLTHFSQESRATLTSSLKTKLEPDQQVH